VFGGLCPGIEPERWGLSFWVVTWGFEPADQISGCLQLPRTATPVYRFLMVGATDARGRGRAAVRRPGRRDRHRQGRGGGHCPGAQRGPGRRPPARDPVVSHHPPPSPLAA